MGRYNCKIKSLVITFVIEMESGVLGLKQWGTGNG